jgi:AcrR family transcriptional regulator
MSTSGPTRKTRAERREETRAALRAAAAEVFVERGLQGASVEAISERAGYSRGAFYSNYATKEALLADVLQERVYRRYRAMAEERLADPSHAPSPRESGEQLARIQGAKEGRWLFRLWLELLAHADREPAFRDVAAEFWRGNRRLVAEAITSVAAERGVALPAPAELLATSMIALDIGIAIQHHVDPDAVPLSVYGDIFEALFGM